MRSVKLTADKGVKDLFIAQGPKNGFAYTTKTPNLFWLKKPDSKKAETAADFFGGADAVFSNRGPDGQLYYLSFALMQHAGKPRVARVSPRNLTFSIDGEEISLNFQRPPLLDPKGKMECKAFKVAVPKTAGGAQELRLGVPEGTYMVGARIRHHILPPERPLRSLEDLDALHVVEVDAEHRGTAEIDAVEKGNR